VGGVWKGKARIPYQISAYGAAAPLPTSPRWGEELDFPPPAGEELDFPPPAGEGWGRGQSPNVNISPRRGVWGNRVSPHPRPAGAWGNRVSPCPHPREGLGGRSPPRNNRMFIAALCGGAAWTSDYINEKMGGPGPPKKMIHYRAQRRGNSALAPRGHVTARVCRRGRKGGAARPGLPTPRQRYRHGISAAALPRGDGHGNSTAPGDRSPRGESHGANLRPENGRTPPASRSDPPASNSRRGPGTARWLPH